MNKNLSGYVLLKQMTDCCGLDRSYTKDRRNFDVTKIGNHLYVDLKSIVDPLLALEASQCLNMKKFYPLSELVCELGLNNIERNKLLDSEHVFSFYEVNLFKIPDEIFKRKIHDKKRMINIILEEESEDGYETVVSLSGFFKIGEYD